MTDEQQADRGERAVEPGAVVRAFYATGRDRDACRGEIVAYYDRPAVVIKTEDGRRVTWVASLTEPLDREREREYWRKRCSAAERPDLEGGPE